MKELNKDVEILMRNTLENSDKGDETHIRLRETLDAVKRLEHAVAALAQEEKDLQKVVEEKTRDREQMVCRKSFSLIACDVGIVYHNVSCQARQSARELQRKKEIEKEVLLKEAEITELLREQQQVEVYTDNIHEKFVQARREKNNYVRCCLKGANGLVHWNLNAVCALLVLSWQQKSIQTSEQRLAEIKEKNKIIENETDVLSKESFAKERDKQASRRSYGNVVKEKEAARGEVDKMRSLIKEKNGAVSL